MLTVTILQEQHGIYDMPEAMAVITELREYASSIDIRLAKLALYSE